MPNREQWNPNYDTGNEILDHQHRIILARCNALADQNPGGGQDQGMAFNNSFNELMALAREHFATEEALLAACGYPELEELKDEYGEFEYLAADIVTTENFEVIELQRFLVLWWVGHIIESAAKFRPHLEKQPAA